MLNRHGIKVHKRNMGKRLVHMSRTNLAIWNICTLAEKIVELLV